MKPCEWRNRTFAHLNIAIECFHFWMVGKDARQKIDPKELQLNKNCYRYTQKYRFVHLTLSCVRIQ